MEGGAPGLGRGWSLSALHWLHGEGSSEAQEQKVSHDMADAVRALETGCGVGRRLGSSELLLLSQAPALTSGAGRAVQTAGRVRLSLG